MIAHCAAFRWWRQWWRCKRGHGRGAQQAVVVQRLLVLEAEEAVQEVEVEVELLQLLRQSSKAPPTAPAATSTCPLPSPHMPGELQQGQGGQQQEGAALLEAALQ